MMGTVTLTGAGPGGSELLTQAGAEALRTAGAVLYDRLVSAEILALIPDCAVRICTDGDRGRYPMPREEIHALLLRFAQQGKTVVRLRAGDSFLLEHDSETGAFLRAHGVPFRLIPSVSGVLACPALAGIPLMHRRLSTSMHILTAHPQSKEAPLDYKSLVRLGGTLVFLLEGGGLPAVCAGLLAAGMSPDTPAALLGDGAQTSLHKSATVSTLPALLPQTGLNGSAVAVIGAVCALRNPSGGSAPLPLHDRTFVVTRPRERAEALSSRLQALGAAVLARPCIQTVLRADLRPLAQAVAVPHDWTVFTSPAGVHLAVQALRNIGRDLRAVYGSRLAAVGPATAEALAAYGLTADLVPDCFDGEHLAEALAASSPGQTVLLLRGSGGSEALVSRLLAAGMPVQAPPIYDTVCIQAADPLLQAQLHAGAIDAAIFASASAVRGFAAAAAGCSLSGLPAVCIGPRTAREATAYGMQAMTAENASTDALIHCILEVFSDV